MKSFFGMLTRLSIRFRAITLVLVVAVSALGVVSVTQLRQELIPSIEFPQTIILAQASGMTSDQVLHVLTNRLETEIDKVDPVINIESTTTSAIGSIITARNDFGQDQQAIQRQIQAAIDRVWLPERRIQPPAGQNAQQFAATLMRDVTPDVLIYLAQKDPNYLFQLSPDTWAAFSDDTVKTVLAYLAAQVEQSEGERSALRQLVDQEVVPAVRNLGDIANVTVSGGQTLPGEGNAPASASADPSSSQAQSLLLQLSPEVWKVVSAKAGIQGPLDDNAVQTLRQTTVAVPTTPPALPPSWQMDRFSDTADLWEMRTLTRTMADLFNKFGQNGQIVGALGQTDDLTPDVITQMLQIDPTLVNAFNGDQLAAMSPDVFASLPDDYIASLDGFTRDQLAAASLAKSISGADAARPPVDLPSSWRIQPPQLITFSFDDLPLAAFSIYASGGASAQQASNPAPQTTTPDNTTAPQASETETPQPPAQTVPVGPPLPSNFAFIGIFLGTPMTTADALLHITVPPSLAQGANISTISAGQFFNYLIAPPGGGQASLPIPGGAAGLIGALTPDDVAFLADNDPTFLSSLSPQVFDAFSDQVLALPQIAPTLDQVWNALSEQPQFSQHVLKTAQDVLDIGGGQASKVLNTIDQTVPERFAGYEVRLFDSLTTGTIRYFALHETDFYTHLDSDVLQKLSSKVLAILPPDFLNSLDQSLKDKLTAIASGAQPSAMAGLASRYATNLPPADPNAPALNPDWGLIAQFYGIELDTADDFFRFPSNFRFKTPSEFMNSLFATPAGAAFAKNLYGNMPADALSYILQRDPHALDDLTPDALRLLKPDVLSTLPQSLQDRATATEQPFTPTDLVTRTNGASSLLVTVYKKHDANTVEAYHQVDDVLNQMDAQNDSIRVGVSFEQSSFIEESISGVAREGGLGAIFAVVVILLFLSGGTWRRSPRQIAGGIIVAVFLVMLALLVYNKSASTGGDLGLAFAQSDVIIRVLLIGGILAGLLILAWPGQMPYPAWRSTLVTAVSIPLSVLMALALMRWLPGTVHGLLASSAGSSPLATFILRLFPESITLNIMTLSGLTVAIGRVVDDSIVVLENIFRQMQEGQDRREAIITGVRDVSVAIFSATVVTVVVFLPLGLTGGIIGAFFLPFGLAVTYALLSSFVVAVAVVPVMAFLFIRREDVVESPNSAITRTYIPILGWSLSSKSHRFIVLAVAFISLIFGGVLFATRPQAFLPNFGEPQISVSVNLPPGTKILETNQKVSDLEHFIQTSLPQDEISRVQTTVGSGGLSLESLFTGGNSVSENAAMMTIAITDQSQLDALTQQIRTQAAQIFGETNVTVSAASISSQGFGGFELVLSGPQDELVANDSKVIDTLNHVPGVTNVTSNLSQIGAAGSDAPVTYLRIDLQSALRYSGELETQDTLGVTRAAKQAVLSMPDLPKDVTVSEGFQSQLQTEGFANLFVAMGIAIAIVVLILIITFGSPVHWLGIILSIMVAPVGAAVALALTGRVLGISALIGMLMLIGIVVTNAVVLIDRVQANRHERKMNVHDALMEAGQRRLRPILMTALATIIALIPLAVGLSQGAIIASELGTVVIGGLFSSTLLTLIVVPVAYSLLAPVHGWLAKLAGRGDEK